MIGNKFFLNKSTTFIKTATHFNVVMKRKNLMGHNVGCRNAAITLLLSFVNNW